MMMDSQRSREMNNIHKILFTVCTLSLLYKYYTCTTPHVIHVLDPKFTTLGPYNTTTILTDDNYSQLIDLQNFSFIINPQPCRKYSTGLLLVVIVSSNPKNYVNRKIIRNTWGKNLHSTKIVFLIGETENANLSNSIQRESWKYGDIVQGNFIDVYRNMTYKHVMGLKWVVHYCPTAKYILKTDDDIVVNSNELRHFLARELSPWGAKGLIACQVFEHAEAQRSNKSKWRVSQEEYPAPYYPSYCAGWAILYSQDVISQLLRTAQKIPYFWIDDVHITGVCAEMIGVPRTSLSKLILTTTKVKALQILGPKFVDPFVFGPPELNPSKIKEIWRAIPE